MKKNLIAFLSAVLCFSAAFSAAEPLKKVQGNEGMSGKKDWSGHQKTEIVRRGGSGKENLNAPPPFDFDDAEKVEKEAEALLAAGKVQDGELEENLILALARYGSMSQNYRNSGTPGSGETLALMDLKYDIENMLGRVEKGERGIRAKRFIPLSEKGEPDLTQAEMLGGDKFNTGWILDQKIYDVECEKYYPTMPVDIKSHDEGASDIEVDDEGWIWEVQSFYFTDTTSIPDHPNASYCLAVYVSPDGGSTWWLYEVLYDPSGKDIINPRLAVDILPAENRFFIAYEYAYSKTDHDIYVYSESFSMTPDPQDIGIGVSSLMERNPDIACDYHQGQTEYRVVTFEKEASAGSYNYDIYASQCGGGGQLLANPGFESGNVSWNASNANIIGTGQARTGTYDARIGTAVSTTDTIYQDVYIPAGASASFSLWIKIVSAETTTTTVYDTFNLQVRDTSGTVQETLLSLSNLDKTTYASYTKFTYDLSAYSGTTVRMALTSTNDSLYVTSFYADDLALDVDPNAAWSAAAAVAADPNPERNPSISNGASGSTSFTQYMHLAYNYDLFATSQMLLNNGFESGNNGDWTVNSSGDIDSTAGHPRTGTYCAWLAGVNSYTDFIYQDVAIPGSGVQATLSLYMKMTTEEGSSTPYDNLFIQLRDTANNVLATLQTISNVNQAAFATYQPLNFDVTAYGGQTVRVYFLATTDSSSITSFFIDDTALNVTTPSGYEVRYAKAAHPGSTSYPAGLQSAAKLTVLGDVGIGWEYGPPSVVSTHGGGSSSWTQARIAVAADQHFRADSPNTGDLDRHQICFAWNMCNGGTTCGTMTCGEDTLSMNWQEAYFYDGKADERYPSLIQDGAGLQTSGLSLHPYIYMAYFHRAADSPSELGEVQMILAAPSDETCDGFIYAYWYYFTASYTISDPDNLVSPTARTINAFNYWDLSYAGAGATFNKKISHLGGGTNQDVFSTTLGDNYTFYTFSGSDYLDLVISLDNVTYATKHTFPWASNYTRNVIAVSPQEESGYTYTFSSWSNGQTDPTLSVVTDYCDPVNPCPTIDFIATYDACLTVTPPVIGGVTDWDGTCSLRIDFTTGSPATRHDLYVDGGGAPALTDITSPVYYTPTDGNSHGFVVRAVNGACIADSGSVSQGDPNCGVVSCVTPGATEYVVETVNTDKTGFKWANISSLPDNYRVVRALRENLAAMAFSCIGSRGYGLNGTTGFVFDGTADDPQGVSGRCYYYIIQGYDCSDPDEYVGPAGDGVVTRTLPATSCDGD